MSFIAPKKEEILQKIGDELVEEIRKNLSDAGINASGNLSDSLEAVVVEDGLVIYANYYMDYAQKGRPAGRIPYDFTSILTKWISDKHLAVPDKYKTARQWAGAIANKIRFFGSERYMESRPVDVLTEPTERAAEKLMDRLGTLIYSTILEK